MKFPKGHVTSETIRATKSGYGKPIWMALTGSIWYTYNHIVRQDFLIPNILPRSTYEDKKNLMGNQSVGKL